MPAVLRHPWGPIAFALQTGQSLGHPIPLWAESGDCPWETASAASLITSRSMTPSSRMSCAAPRPVLPPAVPVKATMPGRPSSSNGVYGISQDRFPVRHSSYASCTYAAHIQQGRRDTLAARAGRPGATEQVVSCRLPGELASRHTLYSNSSPEQGAGQRILARPQTFTGGRDEQLVELRPSESTGSDFSRWHLDHAG